MGKATTVLGAGDSFSSKQISFALAGLNERDAHFFLLLFLFCPSFVAYNSFLFHFCLKSLQDPDLVLLLMEENSLFWRRDDSLSVFVMNWLVHAAVLQTYPASPGYHDQEGEKAKQAKEREGREWEEKNNN